jgi:hypothetical protein
MVMCKPLPAHTTGEYIFYVTGLYMVEKSFSVDICTCVARSMAGNKRGFITHVRRDCKDFIKSRPLNSRIFITLRDNMGNCYATLLLYTEVRQLSRSRVLVRVFTPRSEILLSSVAHTFQLWSRLCLQRLAKVADTFTNITKFIIPMYDSDNYLGTWENWC